MAPVAQVLALRWASQVAWADLVRSEACTAGGLSAWGGLNGTD